MSPSATGAPKSGSTPGSPPESPPTNTPKGGPPEGTPRRAWGSLNRAKIVAAALEIARKEGMQALTIRRLAADLGASRMALYRHVADKDALVDLVMDAVAAHDVVPVGIDEGPWQERLRQLAGAMHRELAAYPGLVDLLMTRAHHGPGGLHLVETILRILDDAGLDEEQATRHYLIFSDLVLGRLYRQLHGDPLDHHRNASLRALDGESGGYPRLRAAGRHLRSVTAEQVFEDELAMLIRSVECAVAR